MPGTHDTTPRSISATAGRAPRRPAGRWLAGLVPWLRPAALPLEERNARYLEIEIFWAAFLSAAAAFNAPFALRMGASNSQIGLLSSIPALIALLVTIPSGQFLRTRARRMPYLFWSLLIHRLGYLLALLIPLLPAETQGPAWIWTLIIFTAPASFFNVGWSSMLADVIPDADRARVFSNRSILGALGVTVGVFLAGRWLQDVIFPVNYQALYGVGFVFGLVSLYYILKVQVPDSVVPQDSGSAVSVTAMWRTAREAFTAHPDFTRIVVNTLLHGVGLWMIGPLYVLYFVRVLGASEGWLGLNGMVANLAPVLGFALWRRGVARWGENRVLIWTIGLVGFYPLLVAASPHLMVILVWTALQGVIAPGASLSHFPMLLKICPAEARPVYLGLYTTIMNIGAFVMPLIGVYLADRVGIVPMLIAGGVICLLGSSLFRWRPLRTPDSLAARRVPAAHS
jgi:MFS family permease